MNICYLQYTKFIAIYISVYGINLTLTTMTFLWLYTVAMLPAPFSFSTEEGVFLFCFFCFNLKNGREKKVTQQDLVCEKELLLTLTVFK